MFNTSETILVIVATMVAMLFMPVKGRGRGGRRPQQRRNGGRRNGGIMTVPRGTNITPNVMRTQFKYCVSHRTWTTGTVLGPDTVLFQFAGNGLYNPDLNVILENYPLGLPEFGHLYGRYNCFRSDIKVQVSTYQTIGVTSVRMIVWPHQYTQSIPTAVQTVDDVVGQPNAGKIVEVGPVSGISHGVSLQSRKTSYMLSRPESQIFCTPDCSAIIYSANPTTLWYWNVILTNNNLAAVARPDVTLTVEITYHTNLFEQVVFSPTSNTLARSRARSDFEMIEEKEDLPRPGAQAEPP